MKYEPVAYATLSSKSQVTVPKAVRERLGLRPGARIVFVIHGDQVVIEPTGRGVSGWYGACPGAIVDDWAAVRAATMASVAETTAREGSLPDDTPSA